MRYGTAGIGQTDPVARQWQQARPGENATAVPGVAWNAPVAVVGRSLGRTAKVAK